MGYQIAALLFFVGLLFTGYSHMLRGVNPWRTTATERMTRWLLKHMGERKA